MSDLVEMNHFVTQTENCRVLFGVNHDWVCFSERTRPRPHLFRRYHMQVDSR